MHSNVVSCDLCEQIADCLDWISWLALVLSSLPSNQWLYEYDLLKRLKENRN